MRQGDMSNSERHTNRGHSVISPLYPNRALPLVDHPPLVLLAMCLFGEARGESRHTRQAIAQVVVNRARHAHRVFGSQRGLSFHENIVRVITKPSQFSCMMSEDVNYPKILDPHSYDPTGIWTDCMAIATQALQNYRLVDSLTANSDHYFDDSIQAPAWADPAKETVKLGRLRFFRLYLPALQAGTGTASTSGPGQAASVPPSLPPSSSGAATASPEASQMSFPATPPPFDRTIRHGSMRWLGGRELSSLEAAKRTPNGTAEPRKADA